MPEITDNQLAAPGSTAESPTVALAVLRSAPGDSQLNNILAGVYGTYEDGKFLVDSAIRRADEQFFDYTRRESEAATVSILQVPEALLPVVKANIGAMVRARWADMYASMRAAQEDGSEMALALESDRDRALLAIDDILRDTGAEEVFVSPMQVQGLLVNFRMSIPAVNADDEVETGPVTERPYGRLHAAATLRGAGEVSPCPADAVFGALEAETASFPVDSSEDRADGVLRMRLVAPSAELAQEYADLVAQDPTLRELIFALGHPSAFQLENVGQPYAPHQVHIEQLGYNQVAADQAQEQDGADTGAAALQPVDQLPAPVMPPPVDDGFFGDEEPAPQQIERPREHG
ncbi:MULTISPECIES: hypothetical protein [Achromobacter]|uniref:Uncharacterized protein n=1 Tax=Achromobacter xylosoxidans (strain A8) TaxID=762376 RepID=E3HYH1_ACHXA|nr:hypothetical protein [Achromobacter xylosoxidans]ADP20125.1 hypothetical protein AXYL_06843 [Achromobacter xylosoxidans A8]